MTPSIIRRDEAADRSRRLDPRPRGSIEDELAVIAEELAAARDLYSTFDPDSPPWSAEGELRRLELRWRLLAASVPPPTSPGGGTFSHHGRRLITA
jgi:hypothetical protein